MQLMLEDRADTLLGIVLVSGRILQSADIRADALRAHRVELQQEEAIEQLRFTRTQLELLQQVGCPGRRQADGGVTLSVWARSHALG
jgi:hypothetical protein